MGKSNKPIVWGPFAAGGTVTAFLTPVLILLTLMVALGYMPAGLQYESMRAFADHWWGKLIIFGVIALSLWSQAHRLRITFHDFGARSDAVIARVLYFAAAAGTVLAIIYLARI